MNTCIEYVKERKGEGCKMNINCTLKNIIIFNRKIENGQMVRKIDRWLEEQTDRQAYKQVIQQMDKEKKTIRKIDRKTIM